MIETHALLHQEERETTSDKKVVATLSDYEVIWDLIEPVLETTSKKQITNDIKKLVQVIKEHTECDLDILNLKIKDLDKFNTSNSFLAEKLGMHESAASRLCKKAKDLGLITNHEKNGNPAFYSVVRDPMMMDRVLPHPKELQSH